MGLSWSHDPSCEFYGLAVLIWVIFFYPFLINFSLNFIFQHWIYWKLGFKFFFCFFYGVIKVSWLRLWVLQISQVDSSIFIDLFLTMYNFFNFIFQHRVDWELNFFYLFFIELSRSLDLGLTDYPGLILIIFLSFFSWFFL